MHEEWTPIYKCPPITSHILVHAEDYQLQISSVLSIWLFHLLSAKGFQKRYVLQDTHVCIF